MAGKNRTGIGGELHGGIPVPLSVARLKRFHPGAMVLKLRVRHAVLALKILHELFHVAKLALAGRMVHQADNSDPLRLAETVELIGQRFRTDLGAKMDMVVDLQLAVLAQTVQRRGGL